MSTDREREAPALLSDPNAVHVNMLSGRIARPTPEQIIHIYGADVLARAGDPLGRAMHEAADRIAELEAEVARLRAERDVARRAIGEDDALDALQLLTLMRGDGWRVAVHNDYRQHRQDWTFWLFTHPDGRWVKGEGVSDALALDQARSAALAAPDTGGADGG